MQEAQLFGQKEFFQGEEETLQEMEQRLFQYISAMDAKGFSYRTQMLKTYYENSLDESGSIKPTRLKFFEDRVYLLYMNILEELNNRAEIEHKPQIEQEGKIPDHFKMFFKESAGIRDLEELSFLYIERKNSNTWSVSPYGLGYTTTANGQPGWMRNLERKGVEKTYLGRVSVTEMYQITYSTTIEGLPCSVDEYIRDHENGYDTVTTLLFESREDADAFAKFLTKMKEQDPSAEEKFDLLRRYLAGNSQLFKWDRFADIDPSYRIISTPICGIGINEKFLAQYGFASEDQEVIKLVVQEYISEIEQLLISEANIDPSATAGLDFIRGIERKRKLIHDTISYQRVKTLLQNCESEIKQRVHTITQK